MWSSNIQIRLRKEHIANIIGFARITGIGESAFKLFRSPILTKYNLQIAHGNCSFPQSLKKLTKKIRYISNSINQIRGDLYLGPAVLNDLRININEMLIPIKDTKMTLYYLFKFLNFMKIMSKKGGA